MFDVGFMELVALAAVALFVFGPDKLPKVAADAGRILRQLRAMAQGAREEVTGALGSEFSDLNLSDLDPRAFVKRQLLDERDDLDSVISDDPSAKPVTGPVGPGTEPPSAAASGYEGDAT